jgi:hypothetical protein
MDKETRQRYEELERYAVRLRNKLFSMDPMDENYKLILNAFDSTIFEQCLLEEKDDEKYREVDN